MLRKLKHLDRRWIFLAILISAVLPMIFPLNLAIQPGPDVKHLYQAIDALPNDSIVAVCFDYGPSTQVELEPAALAAMRHMWRKDIKFVTFSIWNEGPGLSMIAYRKLVRSMEAQGIQKRYGVDWVNLGYKAGGAPELRNVGSSFHRAFPTDMDHTPVEDLPLMARVNKFSDIALILTFSSADPGIKQHIQVEGAEYGRPVGGAVTAVNAPELSPYLHSGQLVGLMSGLRGAAEYEALIGRPGEATAGMNVQSIVHMVMVGFIIISNLVYFSERKARSGR